MERKLSKEEFVQKVLADQKERRMKEARARQEVHDYIWESISRYLRMTTASQKRGRKR